MTSLTLARPRVGQTVSAVRLHAGTCSFSCGPLSANPRRAAPVTKHSAKIVAVLCLANPIRVQMSYRGLRGSILQLLPRDAENAFFVEFCGRKSNRRTDSTRTYALTGRVDHGHCFREHGARFCLCAPCIITSRRLRSINLSGRGCISLEVPGIPRRSLRVCAKSTKCHYSN